MSGPSSPRGLLLIALAAVSWGTTGTATTFLVRDAAASPLVIGVARLGIAAVVLAILAYIVPTSTGGSGPTSKGGLGGHLGARPISDGGLGGHLGARPISDGGLGGRVGARPISNGRIHVARRDLMPCIAMGACMAVFQAGYFSATVMIGVALTALIAICSAPLAITVLARLFLAERIAARRAMALALGVTGTAMLVAGPRTIGDVTVRFAGGVALALAAGVAYAVYVVVAKTSLARTAPLPLATVTFAAGALWLAPVLAVADAPLRQIQLGWPLLLYLGVVATGFAYAAYTTGLRSVPAGAAGIASLLEPLTATLLGVIVFGERLGTLGVAGAALLFAALALVATEPRARSAETPRG